MNLYRIAQLNVSMHAQGETLIKQGRSYLVKQDEPAEPDMTICIPDEYLEQKHAENPHLSINDCEYIWTGSAFYNQLINFDGIMLHASAVAVDGKAYLFSAPSGTGKSTHTALWRQYFGRDRAVIINDDKPALRFAEGKLWAFGTPWSGKTDQNPNVKVEVASICFLERAEKNSIVRLSEKDALPLILNQTLRPRDLTRMEKLLSLLDKMLKTIPVYKLSCNISREAVELSYGAMSGKMGI